MKRPVLLSVFLLALMACKTPEAPHWSAVSASAFKQPLSLKRAVELAMTSDLRLWEWDSRLALAQAELKGARAFPNPTFSYTWDDMFVKDAAGAALSNTTAGFSYPIFFWWTRPMKVAAAKANQRAEAAGIVDDQRQLALKIGTECIELISLQKKVAIVQKLLANAEESARLLKREVEVGLAAGHDLDRAEAELLKAQSKLTELQNDLRAKQLALAFALGADRPAFPKFEDIPETATLLSADLVAPSKVEGALLDAAIANDPGFQKAKALREAAESDLKLEYRSKIPLSDAKGSAGPKWDPEGLAGAFSIESEIPILNWNSAGVKKAKAKLLAAQVEEEKVRREIVHEITVACEEARAGREQLELHARPLQAKASELASNSWKLFQAGELPYSEYLLVQKETWELSLEYVDVWKGSAEAEWTLARRLGHELN